MRLQIVVALAMVVTVLAALLGTAPAAEADVRTATVPSACGTARLAPVLTEEPVQNVALVSRERVPVIVVHGWMGTATHDETRAGAFSHVVDLAVGEGDGADATGTPTRSVVGTLQDIPGAAVYTFDYRALAARWVTDPGISDALVDAISCLTAATGHRAVVVAHSMGGLAARLALSRTVAGVPVAEMVSDVVLFGTPNTGSDLAAQLADVVADSGTVTPAVVAGLDPQRRLGLGALLDACGAATSEDAALAGSCTGLPTIDAFASQAGVALRTGSAELAALPSWPESVRVVALAGEIEVSLGDVLGTRIGSVRLGDIIVGSSSAESGVDRTVLATCSYSLFSVPDAPALLGELTPLARLADVARFAGVVGRIASSPCMHANLMRNAQLTAAAGAEVAAAIAVTAPSEGVERPCALAALLAVETQRDARRRPSAH